MKDFRSNFEVEGVKYGLVFNLNVMEAIQDEYGSVQKWGELTDSKTGEVNAKALIFGLTEMMNEAIDIDNEKLEHKKDFLTKKQVGRIVTQLGIEKSAEQLNGTIIESTKSDEKN